VDENDFLLYGAVNLKKKVFYFDCAFTTNVHHAAFFFKNHNHVTEDTFSEHIHTYSYKLIFTYTHTYIRNSLGKKVFG